MRLVRLPGSNAYVNPDHVVGVDVACDASRDEHGRIPVSVSLVSGICVLARVDRPTVDQAVLVVVTLLRGEQ